MSIKQALLNPIEALNIILKLGFPNSAFVYANTLYTTIAELFGILFNYEENADKVDRILKKVGISDETLNMIEVSPKRLPMYLQIVEYTQSEFLKLQSELVINRVRDGRADYIIMNYDKLYRDMVVNVEMLSINLSKGHVMYSKELMKGLAEYIDKVVRVTMKSIYDPDHVNELLEELNMSKPKHDKTTVTTVKQSENGSLSFDVEKRDTIKMKTGKKEQAREMNKQVNEFDKEHDCKLKKPKKTIDDKDEYDVELERYKFFLAKTLYLINKSDIKSKTKVTIFGQELKKIGIDKKFKDESVWFTENEVDPDTKEFKLRYLSYIIVWLIKNLKKISNVCYEYNGTMKFIEFDEKYSYAKYTVEKTVEIINKILKDEDYEQDLMYFNDLMTYVNMPEKKSKRKKFVKKTHQMADQSEILEDNLRVFSFAKQSISMDTLLKLAYMAATNSWDVRGVVTLRDNYKFRKSDMTKEMIEELGFAIRHERKDSGTPELIKYFIKSDPEIGSRWEDVNSNINLATGIVALKYYAFIVNSKNIHRVVDMIT